MSNGYVDPMNELNAAMREQRLKGPTSDKKKDDDKLSRRDWFAAMALNGLLSLDPGPTHSADGLATAAVVFADLLIAKLDEVKK